jgi:iron complex outermembrane receptor protein
MRRRTLRCCFIMAALPSLLQAQETESDSLHTNLQEVEITATRATELTPIAHTNIGKEQLLKTNTGVDFPYLVASTPSVMTTSDAGTGIGYTSDCVLSTLFLHFFYFFVILFPAKELRICDKLL